MKKILSILTCAIFLGTGVFANEFSALAKNLNALSSTKTSAATGNIPEGKELLPVIWYNATREGPGEKILSRDFKFTSIDAYNDTYTFTYQYSYKFALMTQTAVCEMKITREDSKFYVTTEKMYVTGKKPSEQISSSQKSMNEMAKQFADILTGYYTKLSQEQYDEVYNEAYSNLEVLESVNKSGANKLKLKKWFSNHPLEGKPFSSKAYISKIDESKKEGFAYKLELLGGVSDDFKGTVNDLFIMNLVGMSIQVNFYTNDDKFIEYKENDVIKNLKGKIQSISFKDDDGKLISMEVVDEK